MSSSDVKVVSDDFNVCSIKTAIVAGCHKNEECGVRSAECGLRTADTQNAESQNADTQNADSQNAESQYAESQNADT